MEADRSGAPLPIASSDTAPQSHAQEQPICEQRLLIWAAHKQGWQQ